MKKITVNCSDISSAQQLHDALKDALDLPEWYGHNLDALFDCLTEPGDPIHLVLTDWAQTSYSGGFELVFTDAAAENPLFTYTIA